MLTLNGLQGGNVGRKIIMVGGTFAVAMGAGFFLQQGDAAAGRSDVRSAALADIATPTAPVAVVEQAAFVPPAPEPDVNPVIDDATFEAVVADAEAITPTVTSFDTDSAPASEAPHQPPAPETDAIAGEGSSCDPFMSARATTAAMVQLTLAAPCHAGQALTVHHEGLMFTASTDAAGNATIVAPAMREAAMFIAAFDDGTGAIAETSVDDLGGYDRVVLQWQGDAGFEIHAMEFGANYGDAGHVWREAARDTSSAEEGQGGFLTQLGEAVGDLPLLAEVYTFPTGKTPKAGTVALSVEAEVTAGNCATDVSAQTLERTPATGVRIADLTLSMPECEAIGEFLVLRDLLADLTLAQG